MGAPLGNEYWKIREIDGKEKKYNPEELNKGCNEYFEWCVDNPFKEQQLFHYQGIITKAEANKMRPFTIHGLCNFLDIVVNTFKNYEKDKDYLTVTTHARQIIYNQKFEGAAAGFLNPNIIARDLGLSEKTENTSTTYTVEVSKEEIDNINQELEDGC